MKGQSCADMNPGVKLALQPVSADYQLKAVTCPVNTRADHSGINTVRSTL